MKKRLCIILLLAALLVLLAGCGEKISLDIQDTAVIELRSGNTEFTQAEKTTKAALLGKHMRAVDYFFEHFIPAFSLTLDELETL